MKEELEKEEAQINEGRREEVESGEKRVKRNKRQVCAELLQ